jgi:hypothetical protein
MAISWAAYECRSGHHRRHRTCPYLRPPARRVLSEKIVQTAANSPDIWIATRFDIAEFILAAGA